MDGGPRSVRRSKVRLGTTERGPHRVAGRAHVGCQASASLRKKWGGGLG
jgi:hypothetical protein